MFKKQTKTPEILKKDNISLDCPESESADAIRRCGKMLVESGYVNERYIEGMIERDHSFSTAIGNLIAIPHGEMKYKNEILQTGLVVCTYPKGLNWQGEKVKLVIGIAAKGDEHLDILERIAESFEDESAVEEIVTRGDAGEIHALLTGSGTA
ncbi:MAG: PTS sugar transporter subunit IIA [Clostridiales bacterium]|jgi:mannitol/fructose-specific phosphotransferase system IIA component|nr:PTS sugar transporter subunit IIA [Clostridiales bacterium]